MGTRRLQRDRSLDASLDPGTGDESTAPATRRLEATPAEPPTPDSSTSLGASLAAIQNVLDDIVAGRGRRVPESHLSDGALPLAHTVDRLVSHLEELAGFAGALGRGDLTAPLPSRGNAVAAPLRELHAHLRDLKRQADEIARGDFSPRAGDLGDVSEAFNSMAQLLAEREMALTDEIARREDAERRLEHERDLLVAGPVVTFRWDVDEQGTVLYVSPNVGELGYRVEDFADGRQTYAEIIHPDDFPWVLEDGTSKAMAGLAGWTQEYRILDADGHTHWVRDHTHAVRGPDDEILCYEGYIIDITPEKQTEAVLREREERLRVLSLADELTGLHNRRGLFALGEHALRRARHLKTSVAVVCVDIDGLRHINERFGHAQGDTALCDVAESLRASLRESDVAARAGGDEFVVLIEDTPTAAEQVMERFRRRIEALNGRGERPCRLHVDIGVVHRPPDARLTLNELIELARRRLHKTSAPGRPRMAAEPRATERDR